jgi:hypothetical protein
MNRLLTVSSVSNEARFLNVTLTLIGFSVLCFLSLSVSEWVCDVIVVEVVKYSGRADTALLKIPLAVQPTEAGTFKLPFGLGFFFAMLVGGDDADEGPKVNDRDNDDARAVPRLDPVLVMP